HRGQALEPSQQSHHYVFGDGDRAHAGAVGELQLALSKEVEGKAVDAGALGRHPSEIGAGVDRLLDAADSGVDPENLGAARESAWPGGVVRVPDDLSARKLRNDSLQALRQDDFHSYILPAPRGGVH